MESGTDRFSEQNKRYARQTTLKQVGRDGQSILASSRVAIVGVGALGSMTAEWLVRAGVGFLRVIDRDVVEYTNLSRQVLYDDADARQASPKAVKACARLNEINPTVECEPIVDHLDKSNALDFLANLDVIVDGTDNYATRRLMNDVSVKLGIPWAYAGAVSTYGTTALFRSGETPCFTCLYPQPDPIGYDTCDTVGVFGPAIGVVASLQAASVLRFLLGGRPTVDGVTSVDAWTGQHYTVAFGEKRSNCACCGQRQFDALDAPSDSLVVAMCGRDTVQIRPHAATRQDISLADFAKRVGQLGTVQVNSHVLRFSPAGQDAGFFLFPNGRALVFGVRDVTEARALYARYIGM